MCASSSVRACPPGEGGDDMLSYCVAGVGEAIEAVGAIFKPLPTDSPDFNPIEPVFAKLNALLRRASERTVEALWNRLAKGLDQFTGRMRKLSARGR
jgi:transposase